MGYAYTCGSAFDLLADNTRVLVPLALSPEQDAGAKFLAARKVAMLADKVGFGKSAQFVFACDLVAAETITVLCPPVLCRNEAAEFEKWQLFDRPITVLRSGADEIPATGVVICSYALAGTERVKKALRARGCDVLILDESHHVKSKSGARTKAIFAADGITKTAKRTWFVTGTPTPNHAGEWYVFLRAAGFWSSGYWAFVERYCHVIDGHFAKQIRGTRPEMRDELTALLARAVICREGIEPGRASLEVDTLALEGVAPRLDLPPEIAEAFRDAERAGDWSLLDGPAVATVRRHIGLAKAAPAAELAIYELENTTAKMLIFAEHRDVINLLRDTIAGEGFQVGVIDGRTSISERDRIIESFEPGSVSDDYRVCICQRMALKEGRTMTRATRVLLVEPFWTPEDNNQMIGRAWRRGQTSPVRASFLYLPGSIDDSIARTLARKSADLATLRIAAREI